MLTVLLEIREMVITAKPTIGQGIFQQYTAKQMSENLQLMHKTQLAVYSWRQSTWLFNKESANMVIIIASMVTTKAVMNVLVQDVQRF